MASCAIHIGVMAVVSVVFAGVVAWSALHAYGRAIDRYATRWTLSRAAASTLYAPKRFQLGRGLIWLAVAPVFVMGIGFAGFSLGNPGSALHTCPVFSVALRIGLLATIYCAPLTVALLGLAVAATPRAFTYRRHLAALRPHDLPGPPTQGLIEMALVATPAIIARTRQIALVFAGVGLIIMAWMTAAHLPDFIFKLTSHVR